ncbi:MAG: YraN family protein [Alloprevotella sp.]|nr:YraN family protein [Alloprevotella sp.]
MAQHNDLGRLGEDIALEYLTRKDYRLLQRNWHAGHEEIDIIADHYGEVVFVEVKTRSREGRYTALAAVDAKKRDHLIAAAQAYLLSTQRDAPFRFDVITIVGEAPPYKLHHYRNAYHIK